MRNRSVAAMGMPVAAGVFLILVWCLMAGTVFARGAQPPQAVPVLKAVPEVQVLLDQGRQARQTKRNDQAAGLYEQALSKARALKDRKGEADALRGRGSVYVQTGQLTKALEYYQEALPILRAVGDKANEGGTLVNIGIVYSKKGQPRTALGYYQRALPILRSAGQRQFEANALHNIGIVYRNTGQPEKELENYQEALSIYRAIEDKANEGGTLVNIGIVYANTGQPKQALEYFQQALTIERALEDKANEGGTLVNIGIVYSDTGQPQTALEYYQQALPILHDVGQRQYEANALNGIGNVYKDTGQPKQALEYFQQALTIERALGDKANKGGTLVNIGNVYSDTGQPQTALEYYQQALPILRATGQRQFEANAIRAIGIVYRDTGQPRKAMKYFQQVLTIRRVIGDKVGEGSVLNSIGKVYSIAGQPRRALESYRQVLTIEHVTGQRQFEANALYNIGLVYANTGQPQKALNYYQQALMIYRAIADKAEESAPLACIAEAETRLHNRAAAALHYAQAIALTEQLRTNLGGYSEAKSRYLQSRLPLYYEAMGNALILHNTELAFALAQQTKARNLLDLMAYGRVDLNHDLTLEERRQVQELQQQADFINEQMVKEGVDNEKGAKGRYVALQQQLKQTERQLQTLTDTFYARHPTLAVKTVATTATLEQVAATLSPDTALLEYVVTSAQQITLFVVRSREGKPELHVLSLPLPYPRLTAQTAAFRAACADPHSPYQSQARRLYTQLLAPAQAALSGVSHLVICPDQALWDVPFAALLLPDGRFLADRCEIAYAYSATGLLASQSLHSAPNRAPPMGTLLALANPEFGEVSRFGDLKGGTGPSLVAARRRPFAASSRSFDALSRSFGALAPPLAATSGSFGSPSRTLPTLVRGKRISPLPGTQAEADALHRLFPDAAIYTGAQAQEAVVKREAGKYRYLHFATHGFCNDTDPMLSSIVLAVPPKGSNDDGFLTARELSELNLTAELVVLSACNTARGEERSGEGVIGLSWALLVAGCPTQVVSQWSVNDASTATLMADFYRRLKAGAGKARALQGAGKQLRGDGRHSHPYYWAPFVLLGDGR